MICAKCHTDYKEIVCPECVARFSRQALLDLQKSYLPGILAGEHLLTLTHTKNQALPHIVLVGTHGSHCHQAWCGQSVTPKKNDRRVRYPEQQLANVCRLCREVFDRLVKELPQEVA